MGNLDSKHPQYAQHALDWRQQRTTFAGERAVKDGGFEFLPATAGQRADGITSAEQDGYQDWDAYKRRAVFHEFHREAVETMLGVMHNKPAQFELPAVLEPLRARATLRGESLDMLLRRINEEQLKLGRCGIMGDVVEGQDLPHIALYHAEDLINWDDGEREDGVESLNLVVIDESEQVRTSDGFEWENVEKYRVLVLGDLVENEQGESGARYRAGEFRDKAQFDESELAEPNIRGRTLEEIPFRFVNVKDVVAEPDQGPLLGLSSLALAIYRGEADYRESLHKQSQDTFVTIGLVKEDGKPLRVGAGAHVSLPSGPGNDAKWVGVDSQGLTEQREALQNDMMRAESKSNALVEAVSSAAESGEALRIRVSARTASLNQIAWTGAFALQELLRILARWLGASEAEVEKTTVTPNLDFVDERLAAIELSTLMGSKMLGAPLSLRTVHGIMFERGLTDLTFEEELEEMEKEAAAGMPGSGNADGGDGVSSTSDPVNPNEEQPGNNDPNADPDKGADINSNAKK